MNIMNQNEKYNKEQLEKMLFVEKLSYREMGRHFGVSDTYIKRVCKKLNIHLSTRKVFPENWIPHNKDKKQEKECLNCGEKFSFTQKESKYCCHQCSVEHKINLKYEYYLNNQNEYLRIINPKFLKRHILKEQNNCCDICGLPNQWNGKPIVLVLDHKNGDASNNRRENLRLICPNCDSQLDTYKSKNKNSARKERYLLNYKNFDLKKSFVE